MAIEKLTALQIEKATVRFKADGSPGEYQLTDGGGLALIVKANGSKAWVFRYCGRKAGLGGYPSVSLKNARVKASRMRDQLARGEDPLEEKRETRKRQREEQARRMTLEQLADACLAEGQRDGNWSASHTVRQQGLLTNYIIPAFGKKCISDISEQSVNTAVRKIWNRGYKDTAYRVRGLIREIYSYACGVGALDHGLNFMRSNDNIGRLKEINVKHYPGLFEPALIGKLLRDMRAYEGRGILVWSALNLLPLLSQRPGQLIKMKWDQIDLEKGVWTCPPRIMKLRTTKKDDPSTKPHRVPLPTQAVAILTELQGYTGDHGSGYCFPSLNSRNKSQHISENTLGSALRALGYDTSREITPHGFRSMLQTISQDHLGIPQGVSDRHLAHKPRGNLGDTYDRADLFDQRVEMIQRYADLLDVWADSEGDGAPHTKIELRLVRTA